MGMCRGGGAGPDQRDPHLLRNCPQDQPRRPGSVPQPSLHQRKHPPPFTARTLTTCRFGGREKMWGDLRGGKKSVGELRSSPDELTVTLQVHLISETAPCLGSLQSGSTVSSSSVRSRNAFLRTCRRDIFACDIKRPHSPGRAASEPEPGAQEAAVVGEHQGRGQGQGAV